MRAVLCRELGPPENLTVEEVPDPEVFNEPYIVGNSTYWTSIPSQRVITHYDAARGVAPFFYPGIKYAVRRTTAVEARELCDRVLAADRVQGVRDVFAAFDAQLREGEPVPE